MLNASESNFSKVFELKCENPVFLTNCSGAMADCWNQLFFKEEEIKYLFVDNADRFDNIPGFKAEDGGSGIASLFRSDSFLIKYEDGCFDMRSKRFQKTQGWASEVYVIPCCVIE